MPSIELATGTIDYIDTGGAGPVVVMLHGLLMDGSLWDGVVEHLRNEVRCIVPTLPLGAHRHPTRDGTTLSLPGVATVVTELIERLQLRDVTLVGNDTGGAVVQVVACQPPPQLAKIVLVSCEAFDNIPPGATGRTLAAAARLPSSLFGLFMQQLRLKAVRRLPIAFGWLTKRGDVTTRRWLEPVWHDSRIRKDAVTLIRAVMRDNTALERAVPRLRSFDRPALVVWASEDRVMPVQHGQRLAQILPAARLETIQDTFTLIPLDQPAELARLLRQFARPAIPHGTSGGR